PSAVRLLTCSRAANCFSVNSSSSTTIMSSLVSRAPFAGLVGFPQIPSALACVRVDDALQAVVISLMNAIRESEPASGPECSAHSQDHQRRALVGAHHR